jgi:hypothetical protein
VSNRELPGREPIRAYSGHRWKLESAKPVRDVELTQLVGAPTCGGEVLMANEAVRYAPESKREMVGLVSSGRHLGPYGRRLRTVLRLPW